MTPQKQKQVLYKSRQYPIGKALSARLADKVYGQISWNQAISLLTKHKAYLPKLHPIGFPKEPVYLVYKKGTIAFVTNTTNRNKKQTNKNIS